MAAASPTTNATLPASLLAAARAHPNKPFVQVWDGKDVIETTTYADLAAAMCAAAQFLSSECSLKIGGRVALLAHNSVAYLAVSLGTMSIGGVAVNLNWRQPAATTLQLLAGLRPAMLFASVPFEEDAREHSRVVGCPLGLLTNSHAPPYHHLLPADFLSAERTMASIMSCRGDSSAAVFFTGGTTGTPKAVPHTHASLLWLSEMILRWYPEPFGPQAGDAAATLCFTPYFHVMGFVANFAFNLQARCRTFVLADVEARLSPRLMLDACATLRPTVINTVPWIVEGLVALVREGALASSGEEARAVLSRLHLLTYGGGALPAHCPPVLAASGVLLCCTYGQTELAGPVLFGKPGGDPDLLRPFVSVSYRLDRDESIDGEDEGELALLHNASATPGYLTYPGTPQYRRLAGTSTRVAKVAGTERGGDTTVEYLTGDRFRLERRDDGEWLRYLCRKDDLLVHTSGEMSNPNPSEQAVLAACAPILTEGGCVMCGNHMPRPCLVLELDDMSHASPHATADVEMILGALRAANARQPSYSAVLPQLVWLVPPASLPRTVKGAIQRTVVERMMRDDQMPRGSVRGLVPRAQAPTLELDVADGGADEWADSLQHAASHGRDGGAGGSSTAAGSLQVVVSHIYLVGMALVILHHLPKVREGCAAGCGVGMGALELFGEAVAMPAFATLAGVRDRALRTPAEMRRAALQTGLLLGTALAVAHFTGVAARVWWFYRYLVFSTNRGALKAPAREYFLMHLWFMLALPAWRLAHAALFSAGWRSALPPTAALLHFACWGANCRWPFVRHPHELDASIASMGLYSHMPWLRTLAAALPQNDVSVAAPYFFYYATLPALLPAGFPLALPPPPHPIWLRGISRARLARALWVVVCFALLAACACAATLPSAATAALPVATPSSNATLATVVATAHNLRTLLEASFYHSKRAYGCTGTVFPPRPLVLATDAARPCGGTDGAGGWSVRGVLLDALGTTLSSIGVIGVAASVPRAPTSWTAVGSQTLSVYLLHLYVLPAVDYPLSYLVQAAAYFGHPETAAPAALLGSLLVMRALAMPLPALPRTSSVERAWVWCRAKACDVYIDGRSDERERLVV